MKPVITFIRTPSLAPKVELLLVQHFIRGILSTLYLDDLLALLASYQDPELASRALQ